MELWIKELGLDKENAAAFGKILAEAYMRGYGEGLYTTETEVLDLTEAKFVAAQTSHLVEWYLEELPETGESRI